jgi:hypothetical protein
VNLNLTGVVLLGTGVLFLYSAVKNIKPQDFLRNTIKGGGSSPASGIGGTTGAPGTQNLGGDPVTPLQPFENRSGL